MFSKHFGAAFMLALIQSLSSLCRARALSDNLTSIGAVSMPQKPTTTASLVLGISDSGALDLGLTWEGDIKGTGSDGTTYVISAAETTKFGGSKETDAVTG